MDTNSILPITFLGQDSVLREPTRAIASSEDMHALAQRMKESMHVHDGIGLAAPQVGKSIQMFVIDKDLFSEDIKNKLPSDTYINPHIIKKSFKRASLEEGCLSIPGVFGEVPRAIHLTIEAYDLNWKKISVTAEDLLAIVFQHEVDHLNSTLFVDRAKKKTLYKIEGEDVRNWNIDEVESK